MVRDPATLGFFFLFCLAATVESGVNTVSVEMIVLHQCKFLHDVLRQQECDGRVLGDLNNSYDFTF